jgi:predicted  nucleic acid-binding Zn-ribbon protein
MTKRKTDAEFKKEVRDLVGDEYEFLEPYVNKRTKLRVAHNKCGNVYEVLPSNFLSGNRCPYCFRASKQKTNSQFKREIKNLVGSEYVFLDPYQGNHHKLRVKHTKCGHVYKVRPNNFLSGQRCPYCYGNDKKTDAQFQQEVRNLVGFEYTFLDAYVNNRTKIRVKHNKCGHVYEVKPNSFLQGKRCPKCFGNAKKANDLFKKEVFSLVGDEYIFLDSYVNNKTKIRVKHNECGHIYYVAPTEFFSHNTRCPFCNSSKGELIITKILNKLSISYKAQKTFDDLKDSQPLSYDFFIPDQNILIEYQGIQHYEPVDHFGGEDKFKLQQKHDKMKADYAKDHGYHLIAVPYTYDTFSNIKKYLIKHGLSK